MEFTHFYLHHIDERAGKGQQLHLLPLTEAEAAHLGHLTSMAAKAKTTTKSARNAEVREFVEQRVQRNFVQHDHPGTKPVTGGIWVPHETGPRELALWEFKELLERNPLVKTKKPKQSRKTASASMAKKYFYAFHVEHDESPMKKVKLVSLEEDDAARVLHVDRYMVDSSVRDGEKKKGAMWIKYGILTDKKKTRNVVQIDHEGHAAHGDLFIEEKDGHRRLDPIEVQALLNKHKTTIK